MNSAFHLLRVLLKIDQPETQVTDAELNLLLKYAAQSHVIVELGCYEGKTTVAMAQVTQGTVYSVDPFFSGRLGISYGQWIASIYAKQHHTSNIYWIKNLSWQAAPAFNLPINLLFIDADHSFEAIAKDWADWSPKVTAGSFIALHDVRKATNSPYDLGSMQFFRDVIQVSSDYIEVDTVDSLSVVQKLT